MTNLKKRNNICSTSTPYKYNGGQLYNQAENLCISVDWFQIVTSGFIEDIDIDDIQDSYVFDDVTLVVNEALRNGTKHYMVGFDVLYAGEMFAKLLLFPRSSILKGDSGSLQVNNNILYQRGWVVRLEAILEELNFKMNNVTRLDIAIDGSELFEDWAKYEKGEYSISGKAETNVYRSSNRTIKQFEVGSKKSDKRIVGYNKTKELIQSKSNKLYIKEHWKRFDIDLSKDVHRLELRLRNKAVKTIVGFNLSHLEDAMMLSGIMRSQMENYFEYRLNNEKDTNKRRTEKIQPIDWSKLKYHEVNKQIKTSRPSSIWSAQRYLTHGLREIHAGMKDNKNLFDNKKWKELNSEAYKYGLSDWWVKLNTKIERRDKAIISEMRFKHKEYEATGKTFTDYNTNI